MTPHKDDIFSAWMWRPGCSEQYRKTLDALRKINVEELSESEAEEIYANIMRFWAAIKVRRWIQAEIREPLDLIRNTLLQCRQLLREAYRKKSTPRNPVDSADVISEN